MDRRDFLGGATALAGTSLLGLAGAGRAEAAEGVTDRMPPIAADKWTDAQKKAAEEITSGPRKELVGPFIPLLRSPEFMSRLQRVGEYLRFNTKLGSNISEFIILIIARQWTQQFEWYSHVSLALKAGIKEDTIKAIAEGQRPAAMTPDEEMIYDYISELRLHQSVSDAAYAKVGEPVRRTGRDRHYRIVRLLHPAGHAHECDAHAFAAGENAAAGYFSELK